MAESNGWERGLRALDNTVREQGMDGWSTPQPLIAHIESIPYPLEVLPETFRNAVQEVEGFTKAPVSLIANSALTTASLAVQAVCDVKRDETLSGPCSLYCLTIAESGERKSTVDGLFMDAINAFERARSEAGEPLLKDHAAALEAWESLHRALTRKLEKGQKIDNQNGVDDLKEELRKQIQEKPNAPRIERLRYTDVTPEALAYALKHSWPSGALVCAEGGAVFGGHAMGKDSVVRTLALFNHLWSGERYYVDRRTAPSYALHDVRLTVGIQVQDGVLRTVCDDLGPVFRKSGFFARFLIAWPESTAGTRLYQAPPKSTPALGAFHHRVRQLLDITPPLTSDGVLDLQAVGMSPTAFDLWVFAYNSIEMGLAKFGELSDIRDVAAKAAENIARLACIFHVFETAGIQAGGMDLAISPISEQAVRAAFRVVSWHLQEARRFFGEMAQGQDIADAIRLNSFLIDWCKGERTTMTSTREAQQYGPIRDKARLGDALRYLEELDRVRVGQDGRRKMIRVNPDLIGGRR